MRTRLLSIALSTMVLAGCNAMPKSGIEARTRAHDRMDQVTAAMSRKQALNAFETGQLDKARQLVTAGIERHAEDPQSWALLGRILMEQLRLDEAVLALNRAVELDAEHAESHYFLGVIYERWSKDSEAAKHYTAAHQADPAKPQYLMAAAESRLAVGDVPAARALIEERLARFEHHAAMQHLLAHMALLENDAAIAAERCEEARLLAPEDESIARDLCRMRFRAGDWPGCINAVEDWHARFKGVDSALDQLRARSLVLVRRHNEARSVYRALCDADPENDALWRERGLLAWEQGDWDSVQTCGVAIENLRPGTYEATLFKALHARSTGDLLVARKLLESLVKADPDRPEGWALLAPLRAAAGDAVGAAKARDIAVKCDPTRADDPRVTGVFGSDGS